ncbi:MAG: response regulator [Planctomycetes bacterium]|nr:response regulator [Planctomycetota bacterium]
MRGTLATPSLAVAVVLGALSAQHELGTPPIRHWGSADHHRSVAFHDVALDSRQFAWFGTAGPFVMLFDGLRWHAVAIPAPRAQSLAIGEDDTVWIGAAGDLGFLRHEPAGPTFVSLRDHVPADLRSPSDIVQTRHAGGQTLFLSRQVLLAWDGERMRGWRSAGDDRWLSVQHLGGTWYATRQTGVFVRQQDAWVRQPGDFAPDLIAVLAGATGPLAISARHGPQPLQPADGAATPPFDATQGPGIAFAVAGRGGELVFGGKSGLTFHGGKRPLRRLPERYLGPATQINGGCIAGDGTLWLAHDNGATAIALATDAMHFDTASGLQGAVLGLQRHQGHLHVATLGGHFRLVPDQPGEPWRAERLQPVDRQCGGLLTLAEELYVLTDGGLWLWRPDGATQLTRAPVTAAQPLRSLPGHWLLGTAGGLHLVIAADGGMRPVAQIDAIPQPVTALAEHDGTAFVQCDGQPLRALHWPDGVGGPPRVDDVDGSCQRCQLLSPNDRPFVAAAARCFDLQGRPKPRLVASGELTCAELPGLGFVCQAVRAGERLLLATNEGLLTRTTGTGNTTRIPIDLDPTQQAAWWCIAPDPAANDTLWYGGKDFVGRIHLQPGERTATPPPVATVTRIVARGSNQPETVLQPRPRERTVTLPTGCERLWIEFASGPGAPGDLIEFGWRNATDAAAPLQWTRSGGAALEDLRPGTIAFELRARRPGTSGAPTTWTIMIAEPQGWPVQVWVAGTVTVALLFLGTLRWTTRRHRRRAAALQTLIDERTADLRVTFEQSPVGLAACDLRAVAALLPTSGTLVRRKLDDPGLLAACARAIVIVRGNAALLRLFAISDVQALPARLATCRTGSADSAFVAGLVALADGVREFSTPLQLRLPEGPELHLQVRIAMPDSGPGRWQRMLLSVHDETAQRLAEANERAIELRMQDAQRLESLGVLAGGVAHDFNNLLTAILGNVDAVRDELAAGDRDVALQQIETASRRAAELCHQLLAYAGRSTVVRAPFELSALVHEMVEILRAAIGKKATLVIELPEDLPPVVGDAARLRQVVLNLVTNAAESLPQSGGRLTIATGAITTTAPRDHCQGLCTAAGAYVFVRVTDTGIGMEPAIQQRIFEPFFTTKFTGRGLGMAAVLGIVRAHDGGIDIDSEPGRGTTITIWLPAQPGAARPEGLVAARRADATPTAATVLVVDDDVPVLMAFTSQLRRAGCSVLPCSSGREALLTFRSAPGAIDLAIVDWTMPDLDGAAVIAELRRLAADLPVALTSGYAAQALAIPTGEQPLTLFLAKPWTAAELLSVVQRLLQASPRRRSALA